MPSRDSTPVNNNRYIFHANLMNKKGSPFVYHKSVVSSKAPMKSRRRKPIKITPIYGNTEGVRLETRPAFGAVTHRNDDDDDADIDTDEDNNDHPMIEDYIEKTKFTIPNVPENNNIFLNNYVRSKDNMLTLQNELKTIFKESNYNEDTDHDILEVVDI
jgi:hypothetical protein